GPADGGDVVAHWLLPTVGCEGRMDGLAPRCAVPPEPQQRHSRSRRRRVVGRPARRVELVSRTAVATGFSGPGMAAARPRGYPTGVPSVARFDGADGP